MTRKTNLKKACAAYEKWLKKQIPYMKDDFSIKHQRMNESPFYFLRATFFRWCELWFFLGIEKKHHLTSSPRVLAVGDLHVENFGTWRDAEGRLVWGINDFDEAYPMTYLFDLIRLATSISLAGNRGALKIKSYKAFQALLSGYRAGLESGGLPFILEEKHEWLQQIAKKRLKEAPKFWSKLGTAIKSKKKIPTRVKKILKIYLPTKVNEIQFGHRIAGLGSLGRLRVVALGQVDGGYIARETKPLTGSSYAWAAGETTAKLYYQQITKNAVRAQDPFLCFQKNWVVRRLSPHCCKIELASLPAELDKVRLIDSMGWELANVHLGSGKKAEILRDLKSRNPRDLHQIVKDMIAITIEDWKAWKT